MNSTAMPRKMLDFIVGDSWFSLAVYFVAHLAFATIERNLSAEPGDAALLRLSAGLLAAILTLSHRRRWPLLLAAAFFAEVAATWLIDDQTVRIADIIVAVAIPAEAISFAIILTVFVPQPWFRRPSFELFAYIVLAAMTTPLIGGLMSALHVATTSDSLREALGMFGAWWTSNLLGMLLVIPAVFGSLMDIRVPGSGTPRGYIGSAAVALVWLGTITLLVGLPSGSGHWGAQFDPGSAVIAALIVSVVSVLWLTFTATPATMAVASLLAALLLGLFASAPGTVLGQFLSTDPVLVQVLYALLITSSTASFVITLGRFEHAHERPLSHLRRTSGRVVAEIATRLSQAGPEDYRDAIQWSLGRVGRSCGADRCMVIEADYAADAFTVSEHWLRDGVADSSAHWRLLPLSAVAGSVQNVIEGGSLFVTRKKLSNDDPRRLLLELAGARAASYAAIRDDGKVLGVLVLSWLKSTRRWSNETSILQQCAAQMIGSTMNRIRVTSNERDYREKLRELTQELARLDDQIRRETAADLHDGVAQSLALARMHLAQIRRSGEPAAAQLQSLEDMIVTALREIRGVIRKMAPVSQFEFGMRSALREFIEQTNDQLDIGLSLEERGQIDIIRGEVASLVYRAARELVTNAIKHAQPSSIHVELACESSRVLLRVIDDGIGIATDGDNPPEFRGTGLGLFGLRERLRHFNGHIDTHSDESGTRVEVVLSAAEQIALPAPSDA